MEIFDPAAAAKTGGVLPTPPKSREPALMASRIGGPEVNWAQVTLYLTSLSWPAAVRSACSPVPFWSPTRSVTWREVDRAVRAYGLLIRAAAGGRDGEE